SARCGAARPTTSCCSSSATGSGREGARGPGGPPARREGAVTGAGATPWLEPRALARPARVRLFAFPCAGGSAAVFRAWGAALPPEVAVCPVRLPGREARLSDPVPGDLVALARAAGEALRPHLDAPFALFGHSMGA